jgi:hypothetical protein
MWVGKQANSLLRGHNAVHNVVMVSNRDNTLLLDHNLVHNLEGNQIGHGLYGLRTHPQALLLFAPWFHLKRLQRIVLREYCRFSTTERRHTGIPTHLNPP